MLCLACGTQLQKHEIKDTKRIQERIPAMVPVCDICSVVMDRVIEGFKSKRLKRLAVRQQSYLSSNS